MNKYVECAVCEIEEKSFAVTQQYLEVNSILKVNGEYAIERIHDVSSEDRYCRRRSACKLLHMQFKAARAY